MNIVLTGKMSKPRIEMFQIFLDLGINVQKGVTYETDYLVEGSRPGSSKIKAAKQKGAKLIDESEFWEYLIDEHPEYLL